MGTYSPPSSETCRPSDLRTVLDSMHNARWCHHGRYDWACDCIGLLIVVYRGCGVDIESLDLPYLQVDGYQRRSLERIRDRLSHKFRDVTTQGQFKDGDIVVMRGNGAHAGVVCGNCIYEMVFSGLTKESLDRALHRVVAVYRHKDFNV